MKKLSGLALFILGVLVLSVVVPPASRDFLISVFRVVGFVAGVSLLAWGGAMVMGCK